MMDNNISYITENQIKQWRQMFEIFYQTSLSPVSKRYFPAYPTQAFSPSTPNSFASDYNKALPRK